MKIFISPSSQENNVGTHGYVEEYQMNKVADVLIPELIRHGIEVMRNNKSDIYSGHVTKSNLYKPDYHIAIHSNARGSAQTTEARGCDVFCYNPLDVANKGTQMAKAIYKYCSALTPVADRGIHSGKETMSEIRNTNAPSVLIEIDFHDSENGAIWVMNNINQIAKAILDGILEQCGITYIPKRTPEMIISDLQANYASMENLLKASAATIEMKNGIIKLRDDTIADLDAEILILKNKITAIKNIVVQ